MIAQPEDTSKLEELVGERIDKDRGEHVSHVDYPHAYASEAGSCRRRVAFRVAGFDRTEPMDIHGKVATRMGTDLHDVVQRALGDIVETEVPWELPEWSVTGRADIIGKKVVGEIKSMHSYPFEMAVHGKRGGEPEGPKMEHLLQAAMSAEALNKDQVRLIYVNKAKTAKTSTFAQWTVPYDDELREATHKELLALRRAVNFVVDGEMLTERSYNDEDIENPSGTRWPCGYCGWKSICSILPTEAVDIWEANLALKIALKSVSGTRS